jgi:hypothetical protein
VYVVRASNLVRPFINDSFDHDDDKPPPLPHLQFRITGKAPIDPKARKKLMVGTHYERKWDSRTMQGAKRGRFASVVHDHKQGEHGEGGSSSTDIDFYTCLEFEVDLPGPSLLHVGLYEEDEGVVSKGARLAAQTLKSVVGSPNTHAVVGERALVGNTVIDVEDRLGSAKWRALGSLRQVAHALRLTPELRAMYCHAVHTGSAAARVDEEAAGVGSEPIHVSCGRWYFEVYLRMPPALLDRSAASTAKDLAQFVHGGSGAGVADGTPSSNVPLVGWEDELYECIPAENKVDRRKHRWRHRMKALPSVLSLMGAKMGTEMGGWHAGTRERHDLAIGCYADFTPKGPATATSTAPGAGRSGELGFIRRWRVRKPKPSVSTSRLWGGHEEGCIEDCYYEHDRMPFTADSVRPVVQLPYHGHHDHGMNNALNLGESYDAPFVLAPARIKKYRGIGEYWDADEYSRLQRQKGATAAPPTPFAAPAAATHPLDDHDHEDDHKKPEEEEEQHHDDGSDCDCSSDSDSDDARPLKPEGIEFLQTLRTVIARDGRPKPLEKRTLWQQTHAVGQTGGSNKHHVSRGQLEMWVDIIPSGGEDGDYDAVTAMSAASVPPPTPAADAVRPPLTKVRQLRQGGKSIGKLRKTGAVGAVAPKIDIHDLRPRAQQFEVQLVMWKGRALRDVDGGGMGDYFVDARVAGAKDASFDDLAMQSAMKALGKLGKAGEHFLHLDGKKKGSDKEEATEGSKASDVKAGGSVADGATKATPSKGLANKVSLIYDL